MRQPEQPSGTVTFLFSDIEGSTELLHELGSERYALALDQHRALLRRAFERSEGYEVNCEGDEFIVAFHSAADAVAAAGEAQQALAAHARQRCINARLSAASKTLNNLAGRQKRVIPSCLPWAVIGDLLRSAGNRRAFACRDRAGGLREAGGREV